MTEIATLVALRYGSGVWERDTVNSLPREIIVNYYKQQIQSPWCRIPKSTLGITWVESRSNQGLLNDIYTNSPLLTFQDMMDQVKRLVCEYEAQRANTIK